MRYMIIFLKGAWEGVPAASTAGFAKVPMVWLLPLQWGFVEALMAKVCETPLGFLPLECFAS